MTTQNRNPDSRSSSRTKAKEHLTASGKSLSESERTAEQESEEGNEEYRRFLRQSSRAAWERLRAF